jgi:hypothetical protein
MDMALVETEKPPRAQNLDEAETKDLGGYDRACPKPQNHAVLSRGS